MPAAPTESTPKHRNLRHLLLTLLCLAWIVPGLVGHDPWKPDEAYSFGLVNHIVKTGDWVVPTLGGEPFMEKPPLYYLTAAAFAKVFSPLLPLHDATRLASGFYMALTLLFVGLSGRELYGRGRGWSGPLILIGCLGLLARGHQLITDVALLTGFALALYGLALSMRRHLLGGLLLGSGVGIGFMSKGLLAPGMLGIISLALPILFKPWRTKQYALCLLVAFTATLPWLTLWPALLYQRSPQLFMDWFWINNLGRFLGFAKLGPAAEPWHYLKILPWYAWPALPLALWTLWRRKLAGLKDPSIHLPLTALLVMLFVLSAASDARELYALPLLLPFSLLAAAGLDTLRRGAVSALYWFGIMVFTFFAGVIWFYWVALEIGIPAELHTHINHLQPAYVPALSPLPITIALLYTVAWLAMLFKLKRSHERPIIVWSGGITLVWGLLLTLMVAWADTGKSYRSMIVSMQQTLPAHYDCMASRNLGEPQRALLEYFADTLTKRVEVTGDIQCELLLVQGWAKARATTALPGPEWRQLWEGARPGDKDERYWLFQRSASQ
jgi:4-amino-4-deoxy-L-arabinose transferase-like glycosyltransferase